MAPDRAGDPSDGLGMGLSIVAAIAAAHDATVAVRPGTDGGLVVEVRFPFVGIPQASAAPVAADVGLPSPL